VKIQPPKPFLKWPGGKRWLAPAIALLLGDRPQRYLEPFLGGGALFLALNPHTAVLADSSEELINCYIAVRNKPERLIRRLARLQVNRTSFLAMRQSDPRDPLGRATRFLYLNRTAFNGLFRVNRRGQFNVPFGCKPGTTLCDPPLIRTSALRLRRAHLAACDFRTSLGAANWRDVVYVDPPYTVMHNNNAFRRYNEQLFSWKDQLALADLVNQLARLGTRVIVTNAHHPSVSALYPRRLFARATIRRPSNVAADPAFRCFADELLLLTRSIVDNEEYLHQVLTELRLASIPSN
jgi:DNA adenine methylase